MGRTHYIEWKLEEGRQVRVPRSNEVPMTIDEDDAVWFYYLLDRLSKEDRSNPAARRIGISLRDIVKKRQGVRGYTFREGIEGRDLW